MLLRWWASIICNNNRHLVKDNWIRIGIHSESNLLSWWQKNIKRFKTKKSLLRDSELFSHVVCFKPNFRQLHELSSTAIFKLIMFGLSRCNCFHFLKFNINTHILKFYLTVWKYYFINLLTLKEDTNILQNNISLFIINICNLITRFI